MPDPIDARAVWFRARREAEIRAETVPPPASGEVRVYAIASALSQGTERLVFRGEVPTDIALDLPTLRGSFAFPIKYGYAAVGRVAEVGEGVSTLVPGDLVFALHPHQTAFTIAASLCVRVPPDVDPWRALFVANLETAVNILHDTPLCLGETAVVLGQGVVGLLVAQLLRRAGARRVFAVDPAPLRRSLAESVGVDRVFDLHEMPALVAANDGRAPDVVIEASGNAAALQSAIDLVADDGTVVVASWYGTKPVQLQLGGHFHRGRVRLRSSQVGNLNPDLGRRWDRRRRMDTVMALLAQLELLPLITHRIPFEDALAAYDLLDGNTPTGQIILTYSSDGENAPPV